MKAPPKLYFNPNVKLDLIRFRAQVITQTLQDAPETFNDEEMRFVLGQLDTAIRALKKEQAHSRELEGTLAAAGRDANNEPTRS